MNSLSDDDIKIARAFMAQQPVIYENDLPVYVQNKEQEWAVLQLFELAHEEPERALDLIFFIAITCDDDSALDLLMSGPFETLMTSHSKNKNIMHKFESLIGSNEKFAEMMQDKS